MCSRPDYNAYTNNCQNFVVYLIEFACPSSCKTPKTIKEVIDTLILELDTSQMQIRSFKRSSHGKEGNRLDAIDPDLKEGDVRTAISMSRKGSKRVDLSVIILASVVLF